MLSPSVRGQLSRSRVPKGSQTPQPVLGLAGDGELLPSPCLFWVTALSKQSTQQPATRPALSKLSSPAAFRRLLSLHVPVTGPASSRRRQMRSGSRMLWENPFPSPVLDAFCLFSIQIRSQPRGEEAVAGRMGMGLLPETRTRCRSSLVQPLCTLRQHQTKLRSPTVPPEKGYFGGHITSPGCSGLRAFRSDTQQSLSPQAGVTSLLFKSRCNSFILTCDKTNKN